jgi:signal transduction histidine kinase
LKNSVSLAWPGFLALLILIYSTVMYGRHLVGSLALLFVGACAAAGQVSSSSPPMPSWLAPFAIIGPVGLAAAAIRSTRARADAAAQRARALEREKEAGTRAAIAEERARVARELHDVLSHHVSVMVIQAGAAGKVIDSRPDLATNALKAIESSGREAMAELRHLLGLVAPLDDRLHPLPGLDNLDTLIGAVRAAGQPVTLRQQAGAVPRDVHLTAYRVVQEGLTNALRYAPGAPTAVELSQDGGDLVIVVGNGPPVVARAEAGAGVRVGAGAGAETRVGALGSGIGAGAGLIGLTERLRLHHGTLDAGRRIDGGFRVKARIPLERLDELDSGLGSELSKISPERERR